MNSNKEFNLSKTFISLQREAGLAAEMLASGTTLLLKANSSQAGYYNQAFFNISIGFERLLKLIFILHFYNENEEFPDNQALRDYGHDLKNLLSKVRAIAEINGVSISSSDIKNDIIAFLSRFSMKTRYYNLNYISGDNSFEDPIKDWYQVVSKIKLSEKLKKRACTQSEMIEILLGEVSFARGTTESGQAIDGIGKMTHNKMMMSSKNKEGRIVILQIVRDLTELICAISCKISKKPSKDGMPIVPYMSEFFHIFRNDDRFLKGRKALSIYRP